MDNSSAGTSMLDRARGGQRLPGSAAVWILLPVLFYMFARGFFAPTDPDYWWHVRTGQLIVETGAIPRTDPFSYTAAGKPWVTHEWLSEVLLYEVSSAFGYVGNVVLFGLVTAATWGMVYATCRASGAGEPVAAVLALLGFATAMQSLNVRPQGFTTLFVAMVALGYALQRRGRGAWLWMSTPLILLLWVNLHGGYIFGLGLIVAALLAQVVSAHPGRRLGAIRRDSLLLVLGLAATVANPSGVRALAYPFTYAGTANASMRYIVEWQSPNFHSSGFYYLAIAVTSLAALGAGLSRTNLTQAVWALVALPMALLSARHVPLFAVLVVPVLAERLANTHLVFARPLSHWRRARMFVLTWPLVVAAVVALILQPDAPAAQFGRDASPGTFPHGAVAAIRADHLQGNLFNEYGWGGYLIHELYPEHRVFVDGRADVYGDEFIEQYMAVAGLKPGWQAILDRYQVNLVVVEKDGPLAAAFSMDDGWDLLYEGDVEKLFRRR